METLPVIPWHTLISITLYVTAIGYVIYGSILYYHLQNYSLDKKATILTYTFFLASTLPLLLIMAAASLYI